MRTSMVSAAFLLVGAGAAALAALEPGGGNNLVLNGSDTLFQVTQSVITSCGTTFPDFKTNAVSYQGGGSGVGAGQMDLGLQEMSPMSRALKSNEYCPNVTNTSVSATATGQGAASTNTSALLVGIDGVAITANQTNDCQADATANPTGAAIGFGSGTAFAVTGTPCNGCTASNTYLFGDSSVSTNLYKNQPSFDALAVIYFGLTHDGFYNCSSAVRKSLVANWGALFNTGCSASGSAGACSTGLQHAWRRSDLSGTTDAFVSVINPPNGTLTNGKGAAVSVGIGTLSTVPGAAGKSNPFCNSADATVVPAVVSFGGSADFSDFDPIRTVCTSADSICEGFTAGGTTSKFKGDLGLVIPILLPDGASSAGHSDNYPAPACGGTCALFQIARSNQVGTTLCPNGSPSYAGSCFFPIVDGSNPPDPRCIAAASQTCVDTVGRRDGRTFNMVTWAESANTGKKNTGGTYQYAFDANNRFMNGSFYRIRASGAANPSNSGTGICVEDDDTLDIGCLSDSNPCTIGYAGRASSALFGDIASTTGTVAPTKALALNGGSGFVPPFTPASVNADQDLYLENLLATSGTQYPLARRLYVSTIYGTSNMGGGEEELYKCYATASITNSAITSNGFVAVPALTDNQGHHLTSGPECVDYPESAGTSTPAPNVQGPGAVALGGCTSGAANVDACQAAASRPVDINGAAIQEAQ